MPSKSSATLNANKADLVRLWELHGQEAGSAPGRKVGVEVLNKAVVVLVCAIWEAYCEDIVDEAINNISKDCADHTKLPKELKVVIAKKIHEAKHEHAPWDLAGEGWKTVLRTNAEDIIAGWTGKWNTPKSQQIRTLFESALGIPNLTSKWKWHKNTVESVIGELDYYVKLRGEIAHRAKSKEPVHKGHGERFFEIVTKLSEIIDLSVGDQLFAVTGKKYW